MADNIIKQDDHIRQEEFEEKYESQHIVVKKPYRRSLPFSLYFFD